MKYKAITYFKDSQDTFHAYHPGDEYPREGLQVSEKRLEELATDKNRRGTPVIEAIPEKKAPKAKTEPPTEPTEEPKPKRARKKKDAD